MTALIWNNLQKNKCPTDSVQALRSCTVTKCLANSGTIWKMLVIRINKFSGTIWKIHSPAIYPKPSYPFIKYFLISPLFFWFFRFYFIFFYEVFRWARRRKGEGEVRDGMIYLNLLIYFIYFFYPFDLWIFQGEGFVWQGIFWQFNSNRTRKQNCHTKVSDTFRFSLTFKIDVKSDLRFRSIFSFTFNSAT